MKQYRDNIYLNFRILYVRFEKDSIFIYIHYLSREFVRICIRLAVTIMWISKKDLSYDICKKKREIILLLIGERKIILPKRMLLHLHESIRRLCKFPYSDETFF